MWTLKRIQRTRVRSRVTADRLGVSAAGGAGVVARNQVTIQVTILERVEPGSVSLDARDQAGTLVLSRRQMTKRTTNWTIGGCRLDR
jgi:hypothetical protein